MKIVMNGLRVYFYTSGQDAHSSSSSGSCPEAFYSRRADGPYYHWRYEETRGGWCCSRVRLPDPALKALSIANWKSVPTALQTRLGEHYLD
jgi:hypothetical protein